MALCVSTCAADTPLLWTEECDIVTRDGGINYLIFFRCDWQFNGPVTINSEVLTIGSITDLDSWRTGVANRYIVRSPEGFGDKPATTTTTSRVVACRPEAITGEEHIVNFTSKNVDEDNLTDCDYWNDIRLDYNKYKFGWLTCDGLYYGDTDTNEPFFEFVPTAWDNIIPDNNNDAQSYELSLGFNKLGLICPIEIPGLIDILNVDVNT